MKTYESGRWIYISVRPCYTLNRLNPCNTKCNTTLENVSYTVIGQGFNSPRLHQTNTKPTV